MGAGEAEDLHLVHGFVGGPAFFRHAVGRDHHSGTVIAEAAVDEDFLATILPEHLQKFDEDIVVRPGTMPGNGDVFHAEFGGGGFFAAAVVVGIDNNGYAHFGQGLESGGVQQAAAVEGGRDLAEIRHAFLLELPPDDAGGRGLFLLILGGGGLLGSAYSRRKKQ